MKGKIQYKMTALAVDTKWCKLACKANPWYNMDIEKMFALAVLEHPRADDKKGTLVMSSSIPRPKKPALEQFLSFVAVQENGCWLWTGTKGPSGYGRLTNERGSWQSAHRWSYEYFVGSIPPHQELDHLCRNRHCVHPEHLEPVSHRENTIRGARAILNDKKSSQYIGVYWVKKRSKWGAQIQLEGTTHHLGYFDDEWEAHQSYMQAYEAYTAEKIIPVSRLAAKKTSRYPGVSWRESYQKWVVQANVGGKQCHLGYFANEEDAYQAYLKATADNVKPPRQPSLTPLERFLSHVVVAENGCWIWSGAQIKNSMEYYGRFVPSKGKQCRAHCWSYEYFVMPIPNGLVLDHTCRNTLCVNPEHLEPVTNRENTIRGKRSQLNPKKSSRYVGVHRVTVRGKSWWQANIKLSGKHYTLGRFSIEEEAHQAYVNARVNFELHGVLPQTKQYVKRSQKRGGETDG